MSEQVLSEQEKLKQQAAYRAVDAVESGMVVGLGTGSTAVWAVRRLGELLRAGALRDLVGIPTSESTAAEAQRVGIPLGSLDEHRVVDVTIDGADEVDPQLNLIKGAGGALLREKIVAQATQKLVIVVDESKLSPVLGTRWAVPVEVISFGWGAQRRWLEDELGAQVRLRQNVDGSTFATDHNNMILDCSLGELTDPAAVACALIKRVGIVEHGLFLGMAEEVIVAGRAGIRVLQRNH